MRGKGIHFTKIKRNWRRMDSLPVVTLLRHDAGNDNYFLALVHCGGLVALMRRASLTSSFTAPVIGSDKPAASAIFSTICMFSPFSPLVRC